MICIRWALVCDVIFPQFDQKLALAPGFVVPSNLDYKVTDIELDIPTDEHIFGISVEMTTISSFTSLGFP